MSKIATKEYKQRVREISSGSIRVLGEYINYATKIDHQCSNCKHVWPITPNNILFGQGCPPCGKKRSADAKRKSQSVYEAQVTKIHNKVISVMGVYINADTKIKHHCNACDSSWEAIPDHILSGSGCNRCRGVLPADRISEHKERLKERHGNKIKLLVFNGTNKRTQKSKYECKCGNVWNTTAMTAEKHGCPACAPRKGRNGNRLKTVRIGRRNFDVQGYEEQALRWIVENTPTKASDIEVYAGGKVPFIKWEEAGKERYHFPDFYIRKQNRFCEVKSVSTFGLRPFKRLTPEEMFESNKRKAIEAIAQGFKYRMLVMRGNGERIKLPEDWHTLSLPQLKRRIGWED